MALLIQQLLVAEVVVAQRTTMVELEVTLHLLA
jgi:hypothetical protein